MACHLINIMKSLTFLLCLPHPRCESFLCTLDVIDVIECDGKEIYGPLPQTPNPNRFTGKPPDELQKRVILQHTRLLFHKPVKVKESLRNCCRQEEPKEAWRLNVLCYSEWEPGTEKSIRKKTEELPIKYGLQSLILHQYCFINFEKYTIQIKMLIIKILIVGHVEILYIIFSFFQ